MIKMIVVRGACWIVGVCLLATLAGAEVIAPATDPSITTHSISYKNITIGITSHGGGMMNQLIIGGIDLMGPLTDRYGRGGQTAIRDRLHSGRYNPTQAGFNENIGTPCAISADETRLIVLGRACALWHGDGAYDFTRWENIGADPYTEDGGNSDVDPIADVTEKGLARKQIDEVESVFDYWGVYARVPVSTHDIAVFQHKFEFRYIRNPGFNFSQFGPGSTVLNPKDGDVSDLSNNNPVGAHPDLTYHMANMIGIFEVRFDQDRSPFTHTRWVDDAGNWQIAPRTGKWNTKVSILNNTALRSRASLPWDVGTSPTTGKRLILAVQDVKLGGPQIAFGLYFPASGYNNNCIVGRDRATGAVLYVDNRTYGVELIDRWRTVGLEKIVVSIGSLGIINPVTLQAMNAYELFRGDVYMLFGNPTQIREVCENDLGGI